MAWTLSSRLPVLQGIDQPEAMDRVLKGARLGVMTAGGAVNRRLCPALDVLRERYHVTALYNTVLGIRGDYMPGETVPFYIDGPSGLPVFSAFNRERTCPPEEGLALADVLVFDIREAGARYFEYLHCLGQLMKAGARTGKPVVVLDRAAPLGGDKAEGTVCPPNMHTIVGDYGLASRTALTAGEFARYINGEFHLGCSLTIIPCQGWRRAMLFDETDLPWTLPSPSLPTPTANLLYVGMCLFEGVATISEGRGTSRPFELVGAPWLDADELLRRMNQRNLPGVLFGRTYFRPTASKHQGQVCHGLQIAVRDAHAFDSFATALTLLEEIRGLHPDQVVYTGCEAGHDVAEMPSQPVFTRYIDKLMATDAFTQGRLDARGLLAEAAPALAAYVRRKRKYEMYE